MLHTSILKIQYNKIWEIGNFIDPTKKTDMVIFRNNIIDIERLIIHTILIIMVFVGIYLLINIFKKNHAITE